MITAYKWQSIARTTTIGASTGIRVEFGESFKILLTTSIDWGNAVISVQNSNLNNTIVASVRLRQNGIHYYLDLKVSQSFSTDFKIELYDNTYWEESSGVSDLAGATLCIIDDINSINTPSSYGESFFQEDENGDLVPKPKADGSPRGIWTNSFMSSGGRNTTNPGGGGGISYFEIVFENDPDTKYPLSNGVVTLPAYPTIPNLSNYITKDFADTTYLSKTEFKAFKDIFDSMFAFDKDGYIHAKKSLWSDGFLSSGGKNASAGEGGGGISYFEIVFENDPDTKYALDDGVVTLPPYPDLSGYLSSTTKYALSGSVGGDALNALKLGGNLPAYYATASSVSVLSDALSSFRSLFDEMFEKDADGHIHAKLGLYSDSFLSSGGKNTSGGSGGGLTKFSIIFNGNTYDSDNGVATIDGVYATENYVDTAIANLINGAPSTLDTLKEIADAFAASQDVITALNLAIGTKAAQTDLETLQGYFTGSIANEAAKVSNTLTFGAKTYDGSAAKTITAADLGALTSHQTIYKLTFNAGAFTAADFTANTAAKTINIPTTTSHISEGTNLYYTDDRALNAITGAASTIKSDNLTVSRALISNAKGKVAVSDITSTELGYLDGVTKNIQTQFSDTNTKIDNFIALFNRLFTYEGTEANPTSIHAKLGLWTDSYLSSGGKNESGGSGGGGGLTSFSVVLNNKTYTSDNGVATITEQLQPKITAANPLPYSLVSGTPTLGSLAYKNSLAASDVPNLDWSKITSGKPTTLAGYGITDAISTSGGTLTSTDVPLTINRTITSSWGFATIQYQINDTVLGYLGFDWNGDGVISPNRAAQSDYYILIHSGNYSSYALPLSGGTLEGSSNPLKIKRTDGNGPGIEFYASSTRLGSVGVGIDYEPYYYNANAGYLRQLIHSGNIGSQSVDAATRLARAGSVSDANTITFTDYSLRWYSAIANTATNLPSFSGYQNGLLVLPLHSGGTTAQIYVNAGNRLYFRGNTAADWKTIAFTDSDITGNAATASNVMINYLYNQDSYFPILMTGADVIGSAVNSYVATDFNGQLLYNPKQNILKAGTFDGNATSATKLQTARTIWGQSFDGTGNVGGNIFAKNASLIIKDENNDNAAYFGSATPTLGEGYVGASIVARGARNIYFSTNGNPRMLINSSGNVTIGTIDLASTNYKLYVEGGLYASNLLTDSFSGTYVEFSRVSSNAGHGGFIDFHFNGSTVDYTSRIIERANGNLAINGVLYAVKDTYVGIGRTDPQYKLDVYGQTRIVSSPFAGLVVHRMGNASTMGSTISLSSDYAQLGVMGWNQYNEFKLQDGEGNKFFYGGKDGVTIDAILYAPRGASVDTLTITNQGALAHIKFSHAGFNYIDIPTNGIIAFTFGTQSQAGSTMYISNGSVAINGNISASGDIIAFQSSDARLKENIITISDDRAIDILLRLNPVTFDWNDTATSLSARLKGQSQGFIAQEWETIIPNASGTMWDKYKGIDYIQTIPYLTKGWQIHETKIKRLEREVKELKDKLQRYESINN